MQYLYYATLFTLLYVYMGLGLTLVLCPKGLKKYALFLSPVVGYCYLTLVSWYCYNLDLRGTDVYALPILLPPLFFLFFALLNRRRQPTVPQRLFTSELFLPLLVGVITFLIISVPFVTNTDGLTSMSLGNADLADSATISRYLKEFARSDKVGFLGQSRIFQEMADRFFFGGPLSTALASSIFSLEPYQFQSMSLLIFFLFSCYLVYALAREAFRYNHGTAIGLMALYGMSPIMYFTIYQGYQGQMIATTLSLCIFLIHLQAIDICSRFSDYYSYIPLAVLFNWGINLTYSHMLPFIYLLLVVYLVFLSICTKVWATALRWILFVIITLLITSALSPHRAMAAVSQFFWAGEVKFGFATSVVMLDPIFRFIMDKVSFPLYQEFLSYIPWILIIVIIVFGSVNAYKYDRKVFYLVISFSLLIFIANFVGFMILPSIGLTKFSWDGHKSYKWLSFFLPLVLLSTLILFRNIKFTPEHRILYILPLLFIVLIVWNIYSAFYVGIQMSKVHRTVTRDMADLKNIEIDPLIESVNILGSDCWDILWQTNFLLRKKLYFETTTYAGRIQSKLEGQWDLLRCSRETIFDEDTIPVNSNYVLKKAKRPLLDSWTLIPGKPPYSPALAVFGNRLYMAAKGFRNNNIYFHFMTDSGTWSPWTQVPGATTHSPALAAFNNRLYMAVKGATNDNIYTCYMKDAGTWSTWTQISGATTHSPALVVFGNRLYMAVKGANNDNIYICSMKDSGTWSSWIQVPGATNHSPALAVFNNRLYMAVKGATNDNIYICYMKDPDTWSPWMQISGATTNSPALAVFNDCLYMAVKGATNDNIYICSMTDSGTWSSWTQVPGATNHSPALAAFNNRLYMAVKGTTIDNIYICYMKDAGTWSPWIQVSRKTSHSPALAAFPMETISTTTIVLKVKSISNFTESIKSNLVIKDLHFTFLG